MWWEPSSKVQRAEGPDQLQGPLHLPQAGLGSTPAPWGPQNLSVHLQLPFLAGTVIRADIYLVDFPHFVRELQVG